MNYNANIHHRRSIRLKGYDYSQAGLYFITICCHNRQCLFGKIENHEMVLNDGGKIANDCWQEIPRHFPNAVLHEYIVMPNHVHGIVQLTQHDHVGAEDFLPLHLQHDNVMPQLDDVKNATQQNKFQKMIPRSIGSIVKGYKIGVTKWFRNNTGIQTIWQRNYYEHIIRNEQAYFTISEYIINNPAKWGNDKFYVWG